jgi:hypothetical protein
VSKYDREPSKDQTQPTAQDVKGKGKVAEDVEMHEAGGEEEEEEEEEDDDGEEEEEEEGIVRPSNSFGFPTPSNPIFHPRMKTS